MGLKVLVSSVMACTVVAISFAQVPSGPTVTVTVDAKVKVLSYDANRIGTHTPPDGSRGSLFADYSCTATVTSLPEGWTITGYQWGPVWYPGMGTYPLSALTFPPSATSSTATGTAWEAGWGFPGCTVFFLDQNGLEQTASDGLTVAAIGGPLTLGIVQGSLDTWDHDDNDPLKPWYLQDFGHDSINVPPYGQVPQQGVFYISGQPQGAVVTLSIESGPASVVSNTNGVMRIAANDKSSTGGVKPKAEVSLTFDGETGTGVDCSAVMPNPERFKFTAHQPKTLDSQMWFEEDWDEFIGEVQVKWGWRQFHELYLHDNLDEPMPFIFVQERIDPNYAVGQNGTLQNYWTTDEDGRGDKQDKHGIQAPYPYLFQNNANPLSTTHQLYFAGTIDPDWFATTGFFVGEYWIYKWTDRIQKVGN